MKNRVSPSLRLEDFRRLFEASPMAIAVSRRADGVFVDANEAFLAMHGYRRDEVIGHTSRELGLWKRPEERERLLAKLSAAGDSHRFLFEYRRKSGETGRALGSVTVVDVDGAAHLVGFLDDLSALDRAEREILEREARLALVQQATAIGFWEWDRVTGAIRWSPEMERLYGLPPGGFGGRYADFAALVHPDDLARVERSREAAIGGGDAFDVEFRVRRPDGAVRWFQTRGAKSSMPGEEGRFVVGVTADVTARKEAELALRDKEQRLAAATRVSRLTFFAQDRDLRYLWLVDPRLGLAPEEVLGRTDEEAFGAEVAAPLAALKRRVLDTGQGERQELCVEWKGRSGWFDLIVEPRWDEAGRVDGIVGAAADVTVRKEAERALRTSEARLATALKITQLVAFSQDRDLRYIWVANPGLGISATKIIGLDDEEVFGPEDAAPLVAIKRRVMQTGCGERHELLARRGGESGWYDMIFEPDRNADGSIAGVLCAAADITARKEAAAAAAAVHRRLEALAAHRQDDLEAERAALSRDVHDQVGAALTGLRLRLEALANRLPCADGDCEAQLRQLAADAEAAQAATREICARLRPPSLEDLGLAETCRWYLRDWGRVAGIRVAGRFPRLAAEPPPDLAIDLFRIVQELLTNVARHAGAATVKAGLSAGPRGLRLKVADDGRGFAPERVRTGFGLAGIRERAARHGGRVEIESGPGGTTVTVTCPGRPAP